MYGDRKREERKVSFKIVNSSSLTHLYWYNLGFISLYVETYSHASRSPNRETRKTYSILSTGGLGKKIEMLYEIFIE